jgi:hypothetical protein
MKTSKWFLRVFLVVTLLGWLLPTSTQASMTDGTIDSTLKWAWSENIGWINFGTPGGDVHVLDGRITGYAWSSNLGWINLQPVAAGVTNDGQGHLGGQAWGESTGWIDFTGVTIDTNGNFGGAAHGTITGQVAFSCGVAGSCGASTWDVRTDWRPMSVRGGGGGSTPLPKDNNPNDCRETNSCDNSGPLPVSQEPASSYVYRFWSDVFRGHFFTIDQTEAERVKNTDTNWRYEKVAFSAYPTQEPDTVPLYRFWSDVFHGHFYTADQAEYEKVKNTDSNWKYEWVAYYVYPLSYSGPVETEVVYRFWSPIFLHHFYTSDEIEMAKVRDHDSNWTYEGPAYRVPKQHFTGCELKPCSEMVSCQEAQYYYSQCGLTSLDQDGSGIPCKNVCGG